MKTPPGIRFCFWRRSSTPSAAANLVASESSVQPLTGFIPRAIPALSRDDTSGRNGMDRKWVAAVAAVSGIGLVTLTGCDGSAEAETAASMAEQVLMDRIAIEDMVTRYYANFGKQDSADDFGAFYTEDAVFDVNGVVAQGREAIEGFYTDTGDDEEAPSRQGTFHMMISNPVIDVNGDTATAEFMWTG